MGIIFIIILKFISAACEAFLGIPFIGGAYIIANLWTPLLFMFIFHIIVYAIAKSQGVTAYGNIVGIFASLFGWIPVLGMFLHIISGIAIFISVFTTRKSKYSI